MLPDIDVFITFITHRGPTHSIIGLILISTAILLVNRRGFSYVSALSSHAFIGDYITSNGVQLFWPFSNNWFVASSNFILQESTEFYVEILLFTFILLDLVRRRYVIKK